MSGTIFNHKNKCYWISHCETIRGIGWVRYCAIGDH